MRKFRENPKRVVKAQRNLSVNRWWVNNQSALIIESSSRARKSLFIHKVCKVFGVPIYKLNCSKSTDKKDIIDLFDKATNDGKKDIIVLINEMGLINITNAQELQLCLIKCLEQSKKSLHLVIASSSTEFNQAVFIPIFNIGINIYADIKS